MREIKFRAWDKDNKTMVTDIARIHFNKGEIYAVLTWDEGMILDPVLMQYTGLKDKNGKMIFEGDILTSYDRLADFGEQIKSTLIVEYHAGYCGLSPREKQTNHRGGRYWVFWDNLYEIEIIGNIWENKDET